MSLLKVLAIKRVYKVCVCLLVPDFFGTSCVDNASVYSNIPVWLNRWQAYGLLIAEFAVILVLSVILKRFTNLIVGFVSKCWVKIGSKNRSLD